jgi:glycosyltransferase involved in cell wall biosynthesis
VPYLAAAGADVDRIEVIPNWVDLGRFVVAPEPPGAAAVRFLYTGNIGYTQGFETLFEATEIVGDGIEVRVVGGGNFADAARMQARDPVTIAPAVARAEYPSLLASAHVLVVLQRRIAANVNLPSKIASYLASGRPIVASIDLDTPAADLLRASGGALLVPAEAPEALAEAMRSLRDDEGMRRRLGSSGRRYAETMFASEPILDRLERAFVGNDRSAER